MKGGENQLLALKSDCLHREKSAFARSSEVVLGIMIDVTDWV